MRALIEPEGFRNSSLTQIPSRFSSGVSPIASSTVETVPTRPGVPEVELMDRTYELVPCSQASTLSGLASIHFWAASSGVMPS